MTLVLVTGKHYASVENIADVNSVRPTKILSVYGFDRAKTILSLGFFFVCYLMMSVMVDLKCLSDYLLSALLF